MTRHVLSATAAAGLLLTAFGAVSLAAPLPAPEEVKERPAPKGHRGGGAYWVAFSPDGKTLATAGGDHLVKLWDLDTAKEIATLEGHTDDVTLVTFSPDGKTIASAGRDFMIRAWDVATHKQIAIVKCNRGRADWLTFNSDSKTLVYAESDDTVKRWDLSTNKQDALAKLPLVRYGCLAWGTGDKLWAVAAKEDQKKLMLCLWDVAADKEIITLRGHSSRVFGVACSKDGKALASYSNDSTVRLWDVTTGKNTATFKYDGTPCCVAFSPDGKTLACGTRGQGLRENVAVRLIDVPTAKELVALMGHTYPLECVAFSPDGRTLVSTSLGDIKVWKIPANIKATK